MRRDIRRVEEQVDKIIELVKNGKTENQAVIDVGLKNGTYRHWRVKGKRGKYPYNKLIKELNKINPSKKIKSELDIKNEIIRILKSSNDLQDFEEKLEYHSVGHISYWEGCTCNLCGLREQVEKEYSDEYLRLKDSEIDMLI
jgi:hypothetical protein